MYDIPSHDGGRTIDWGRTSTDYADWRPNYPDVFYERLQSIGVGLPDQSILDVGTGVGFLALRFAEQGAKVVGVDISEGQIDQAKQTRDERGLSADFFTAPAEETGLPDSSFDLITASQCWLYFDRERMTGEVRRLLRPGGHLLLCHFCWLPREDAIAAASERLVLEFNPDWKGADWAGEIPDMPPALVDDFEKADGFVFDVDVPFSREQWRGRFRACRGVGASLSPEEVEQFDTRHADLLEATVPEEFTVRHRIDAFLLEPL